MNSHLAMNDLISPRYVELQQQLDQHPLYDAIHTREHLGIFMQHHVYAVWDFMSLIKALQQHLAPVSLPWVPPANIRHANFINQLVLEEESDHALVDDAKHSHSSHFQGYCDAMMEIGADIRPILRFIHCANADGIEQALQTQKAPQPARQFMRFTFDVIEHNQPHLLAAVLAFGRESLVPLLFRAMVQRPQSKTDAAPLLHAYLSRHIQLDEQEHGPLAMMMVHELCEGCSEKQAEVRAITDQALKVRLDFWDGIHQEITRPFKRLAPEPADPELMTQWAS
jgi:hypothetical protein